jgi:small subunit ribosomal protein S11
MAEKTKTKAKKSKKTEKSEAKAEKPKETKTKKSEETKTKEKEAKPKETKSDAKKSEENISKSLVDQVKKGIVKEEDEEKNLQATPKKSEAIAVVHVQAAKNNTIVTVTDLSGAETIARASGGMVVKSGREEKTPFAGGQIARNVANVLKERGFRKVDVLLRGKGGHRGQKSPGRAASSVIKLLARSGISIRRIEDVTPIPHGGSKPPGGKRGRRV